MWPPSTFSGQVHPLFKDNGCASGGCHAGANPKEGLDTSTQAKAYQTLVNVASSTCGGAIRVKPSYPSMSYLINKLTGQGMCSGGQMPGGNWAPLSSAEIDLVRAWIGRGAPND